MKKHSVDGGNFQFHVPSSNPQIPPPQMRCPWFSPQQVRAQFNPLSKVLFIFPSWYLLPIGLEIIFSQG